MIKMLALAGALFHKFSECGTNIRYDGKSIKILQITTIVSALLFVMGIFLLMTEVPGRELIMLIGLFVGGTLFLFSFINLLVGLCYIRRLKSHGYEIPYKKEDYGNDLRNVPCAGMASGSETKSAGSRILCILYALVFLLANVWNVRYIIRWYPYGGDIAVVLLVIMLLFDAFWGISALLFYRQEDTAKYRDDVEMDEKRKERKPLEKGIVSGIIVFCIMVIFKTMVVQLERSMYISRVEHDQEYLQMLEGSICTVVMGSGADGTSDSYMQMSEGCYITDWGKPEDAFSREVAEYLGITDFSQLKERLYTADGEPRIYVKITDLAVPAVYVRMDNPLRLDHGGIQYSYEAGNLR